MRNPCAVLCVLAAGLAACKPTKADASSDQNVPEMSGPAAPLPYGATAYAKDVPLRFRDLDVTLVASRVLRFRVGETERVRTEETFRIVIRTDGGGPSREQTWVTSYGFPGDVGPGLRIVAGRRRFFEISEPNGAVLRVLPCQDVTDDRGRTVSAEYGVAVPSDARLQFPAFDLRITGAKQTSRRASGVVAAKQLRALKDTLGATWDTLTPQQRKQYEDGTTYEMVAEVAVEVSWEREHASLTWSGVATDFSFRGSSYRFDFAEAPQFDYSVQPATLAPARILVTPRP